MIEDEAFIRAIVNTPGDDLPRLVYADWLDERDDRRGAYVRAEVEWAKAGKQETGFDHGVLIWLSGTLDPVWVARVTRPPEGVCCDHLVLMRRGTVATPTDITQCEQRLGVTFPYDYKAILLNYNDCQLSDLVLASVCERVTNPRYLLDYYDQLLGDANGPKGALPVARDMCVNTKNTVYIVMPDATNAAVSEVYDYAEGGTHPENEMCRAADSLPLWLNSRKHRQECFLSSS